MEFPKNDSPFILNNIDEVSEFSNRLDLYMNQKNGFALSYINLPNFYKYCLTIGESGGRLFAAALDLKITFVMLYMDDHGSGISESGFKFSGDNAITCSEEEFIRKCDMLYYYSNFIYRFRAFFDKLMGLLFLLFIPEEYDKYRKAKSRKQYFRDNFKNIPIVDNNLSNCIYNNIETFDNEFRTAEVHDTGTIRKDIYSETIFYKTKILKLIEYWNWLVTLLAYCERVFQAKFNESNSQNEGEE